MKAKLTQYRKEGRLALKHMWIVILVFAVVQVIVSIAVAAANDLSKTGYRSAAFAAIWSMFLVVSFVTLGGTIVFGGKASELLIGFQIGVAAMLTELFFVLMVIFFILGEKAKLNGKKEAPSDQAYAAFSLINMIIYFVWTIILIVHRRTVTISRDELEANKSKEFSAYDGSSGEIYNPTIGAGGGEDFGGDQEQL
jgi:uncharacterized membrane protein